MKDKDLLKLLKKNGWSIVRINGSHHVLQKDGKLLLFPYMAKMFLSAYSIVFLRRRG